MSTPCPLFARFPGTAVLPLAGIAELPTPLETLDVSLDGAASLQVKRDDLTSWAYGGNKVRKLDFLLGQALAEERCAVVTFGAYGSNHALATAVHSRALGLEPHVVLSPQAPGPFAARTLRAHAGIGTVIHPIEGWDGSREAVRVRRELTDRDGIQPYIIPMGGTNALGALGYVSAALELSNQCDEAGRRLPDSVYVAGGTIGTAVGLAVGFALLGAVTRVQTIRVTPGEVCSLDIARAVAEATIGLLREVHPAVPQIEFGDLGLSLRDEFFEPGYGVPTAESLAAVAAAKAVGIPAETTYTGKALAALFADAATGELDGADVLFWDTYNSSPLPPAGSDSDLPGVLQEYVAECDRQFESEKGANA